MKTCKYLTRNGGKRYDCERAKKLKINRPICVVCRDKELPFGYDPKSGKPPKFMELLD